jgi:hypothetical protein
MAGQSKPYISPWGGAVAGATGAVLANALVYPLDMSVPLAALIYTDLLSLLTSIAYDQGEDSPASSSPGPENLTRSGGCIL